MNTDVRAKGVKDQRSNTLPPYPPLYRAHIIIMVDTISTILLPLHSINILFTISMVDVRWMSELEVEKLAYKYNTNNYY